MSENVSFTVGEVEDLATRLDESTDLDDRDRQILAGVFTLAGNAAGQGGGGDVEGFMPIYMDRKSNAEIIVVCRPGTLQQPPIGGGFSFGLDQNIGSATGGAGSGKNAMGWDV